MPFCLINAKQFDELNAPNKRFEEFSFGNSILRSSIIFFVLTNSIYLMNNSRNFLAVIQFFALPFFSFFYAILKLLHVVAHTSLIAKKIVQFVCTIQVDMTNAWI